MLPLVPAHKCSHRLVSFGSNTVKMFPWATVSAEDMKDDSVGMENNVAVYVCCTASRLLLGFFFFVFFFFFTSGNKIAETSRHYPTKSGPNICGEYWSIDCAWQLLADAARRMGPCARVHGLLAEIPAALCTPREWGLAYIECLCCRIESVEHLYLSPPTVKLGLTKNPSHTNGKWSCFCLRHFFQRRDALDCPHQKCTQHMYAEYIWKG